MKALFRYPGSKWSIADWIIGHFPEGYEKMVYLEPFVGSGAVFFNKKPSAVETVNDLDSDIVNLFRVLWEQPEELKRALELTPYSREEYDLSFEPCDDPDAKAGPEFYALTLHCYVLGPSRHYRITGRTPDEVLEKFEELIQSWLI